MASVSVGCVRGVAIDSFGGPDGLVVIEMADPEPRDGEVLIAVEAIGVGGVDTLIRSGALAGYGFAEGHILGGEIAGTVSRVGAGVDEGWVGRRVWAFTGAGGGYVEQATVAAAAIVPLPDRLTASQAVTLTSSGLVARFGLRRAGLHAGERILIRGAAGGIGVMAVQLAAHAGASVIAATTSSPDRGERLRALGATHVLDRRGDGDDTPAAYDVVLDIVGGSELSSFFAKLDDEGRMLAVGATAGPPPADLATALYADFQRSLSFGVFSAATIEPAARAAAIAELLDAGAEGRLRAVVHDTLPLTHARRAHEKMDAGEVFGRLVLRPSLVTVS